MLTEFAEHAEGFNLVSIWIHADRFRPLFGAQAQSVICGKRVGWGREDGRRGDPGDRGKRGKFDTLPRMMSRGPIVLGTIASHQPRKSGSDRGRCTYIGLSVLCLLLATWLEANADRAHSSLC